MIDNDTHVYLVMEYCRGGDLFKRLALVGGCMEEGWVSSQACLSSLLAVVLGSPLQVG